MEGILRTLRLYGFASFLRAQKKSTDSRPHGLPSVASAKDGGAEVDLLGCRFELIFSPKLPFTSYLFPFLAKAERN